MTVLRMFVGFVVLMAVPAAYGAAARDVHADWPKPAEVKKAIDRVKYKAEDTAKSKYLGHDVSFVPADISDVPDATREKGIILGKLVTTWTSADKLPAGTYQVYVCRDGGTWKAFFCQKDAPVAKSAKVQADMGNDGKPSFEANGTQIRYWMMRINY